MKKVAQKNGGLFLIIVKNAKNIRIDVLKADFRILHREMKGCWHSGDCLKTPCPQQASPTSRPFSAIEGVWVNKHEGRYYLQYAQPGARFNVYNDAVYISNYPLGPYRLAENNPFSYKPGGFIPGAGHGSTMEDRSGNV